MTKAKDKKQLPQGDECLTDSGERLRPGILDDHYLDAALEYPAAPKTELLRHAIKSAGLTMAATKQKAYEMHERLRDKIDAEVIKLAQDAKLMGLSKIMYLCEHAKSETVQGAMATTLTKDLFPNVSIRKETTASDLDESIKGHMQEIAAAEGKTVEQVMKEYLH